VRAALEVFELLDAAPWAEGARAELRASGETARTRDPSTRQQLTAQEREVARLAAQGLSNQPIAERLFLSRHTVGYHPHKVYAKLGITALPTSGDLIWMTATSADLQRTHGTQRRHRGWQARPAQIATAGGTDRRSARNAAAPMDQSREAHHSARPHHSREPAGCWRRRDPSKRGRSVIKANVSGLLRR
jgi:DNA-binding CsgD family transcriptional regulator